MAISNRAIAVGLGGALGAYTSDVTDNPLTGILTTAIGAGAGGMLILPEADVKAMANVATGIKQNEPDILQRAASGTTKNNKSMEEEFRKKVSSLVSEVKKQAAKPNAKKEKAFQQIFKNSQGIQNLLKLHYGSIPSLEKDPDGFLKALSKIDDPKLLKQLSPLLSSKNITPVNLGNLTDPEIQQFYARIDGSETNTKKIEKLSKIFQQQMGNSLEEATEKAEMLVSRSTGLIQVKDGSVILNDINDKGKSISVPITGYDKNGVRYHDAGNGNASAVKGFSPHMEDYILNRSSKLDGVRLPIPSYDEVLRGMSPEMALKYLGKDKPMKDMLNLIKSHMSYDSREVGTEIFTGRNFEATSPTFINQSGLTSYKHAVNVDFNGNITGLRKVDLMSKGDGAASENLRIKKQIALEPNSNQTSLGVSNNITTDLQSNKAQTISLLAPMERNVSGSVMRESTPTVKSLGARAVHTVFDAAGAKELYSSAQVMKKLDINDSKMFNQFAADFTKNSGNVLGDGFSLYNQGHENLLSNKTMIDIKIPKADSTFIGHARLIDAINSGNVSEYLKTNGPIQIGKETLGYDVRGNEIKLPKQYTEGNIVNSFINSNNELVLRTEGVFKPNSENLVKIYSVGSKALATGIGQDTFNSLATVGQWMNEGKVEYINNRLIPTKSATGDILSILGASGISKENLSKIDFSKIKLNNEITVIADAGNTGLGDLHKVLNEGSTHELNVRTGASSLMNKPGINKDAAAIAGFLTTNSKASEDLTAHLTAKLLDPLQRMLLGRKEYDTHQVQRMINQGMIPNVLDKKLSKTDQKKLVEDSINRLSSAFRSAMVKDNFLGTNKDAALETLYKYVNVSNMGSDIKSGISSIIGTTNRGGSMVGAGNEAKMSWTAISNLLRSGYSKEQLSMFGRVDEDVLYEINSLVKEGRLSNSAVNSKVSGRERELESILSNYSPEERLAKLSTSFGNNFDNSYISYNLENSKSEIKSLNFGVITTNRGGKYDFKDTEILKQLEKHKLEILSLDIDVSKSRGDARKTAQSNLDEALKNYEKFRVSMFSGDNNLIKSAISLYSDTSSIQVANPIGGEAKRLVNEFETELVDGKTMYKNISSNAFMSENGIKDLAESLGVKQIHYQAVTFEDGTVSKNLFRAGYMDGSNTFVPLSAMITREPAQGTLTSQFMDLIEDRSLDTRSTSIHFVDGQFGYNVAKTADFDQDTLQVLAGRLSRQEYDVLKDRANTIIENEKPYLNIQPDMSPKGKSKTLTSILDFENSERYNEFQTIADYKGKVRKLFAPAATDFAVNLMHALDLEYGTGKDINKHTLGRIAAYRSVENLIKSSHIATEEFIDKNTMSIEELTLARKSFLDTGDTGKYKKVLEEHLPGLLGSSADRSDEFNKTITEAVDLLTRAETNNAQKIGNKFLSPLDLVKDRGVEGFNNSILGVLESSGILDMEKGIDLKRTPQQLYQGLNDVIVDTFKKNKGLLATAGLAAVGINLLGRSEPSFADSRANMRQHSTKMLQPQTDLESMDTGIETNPTRSSYILPKSFNNKSVNVRGEFHDDYNKYNQFNSSLNYSEESMGASLNTAIFGRDLRSARLDITDL